MATHSSVLAWRIPGMGEPGGRTSMGSHRVGHNRSNLAAAAVYVCVYIYMKQIYEKIWKINVIDWKVTSRLEERGTPLGLLFSSLKPLAPGEFPKSYQENSI